MPLQTDVLIIGEAERIWPQFIEDFLTGRSKSEYREKELLDLSISPVPDYSGLSELSKKQYLGGSHQYRCRIKIFKVFCFLRPT